MTHVVLISLIFSYNVISGRFAGEILQLQWIGLAEYLKAPIMKIRGGDIVIGDMEGIQLH